MDTSSRAVRLGISFFLIVRNFRLRVIWLIEARIWKRGSTMADGEGELFCDKQMTSNLGASKRGEPRRARRWLSVKPPDNLLAQLRQPETLPKGHV
ncbi:hypothetical protein RND71_019261 [Anisodus tanguticus]|uniref:Uncharacterized protein n=1 Tax=Anisodus tanguticus TaxID=243964 RepID=A0AAE1VGA7_9SOLA|nr:hypothetical protein RND71_019261 [Anisodus tanguticus]